jgi:VWFA-related protein
VGRGSIALALTLTGLGAGLCALDAQERQLPAFRSGTNVVTVDVSVRKSNFPVTGLTAADFELTDNGVPQTVTSVAIERLPIDVSLLLDTSGSVTNIIDSLKSQIREAAALLGSGDRLRLLVFAGDASQVFPMQPPGAELPLDGVKANGLGTSLYDSLAAALIRQREPDRGELVVAFSDGIDTTSAMSVKKLEQVASRSEAVLHAFIVRSPELVEFCRGFFQGKDMAVLCDQSDLKRVAESTGGRLYETLAGNHIPQGLSRALDEFRTSYTLRYALTGVARPGWHEIKVKVTRAAARGATIRARRGYFGG